MNAEATHGGFAKQSRRLTLLDAAAATFLRYGLRKTSMDDVARAAGVSRQGLYLHWTSKEELFKDAVIHVLEASVGAARAALNAEGSIDDRLVEAFAALHASHFAPASDPALMAELLEAARVALGTRVDDVQHALVADVATLLRSGGRSAALARDLAAVIEAASLGLKHSTTSAADYRARMRVVVRVVLAGHRPPRETAAKKRSSRGER